MSTSVLHYPSALTLAVIHCVQGAEEMNKMMEEDSVLIYISSLEMDIELYFMSTYLRCKEDCEMDFFRS